MALINEFIDLISLFLTLSTIILHFDMKSLNQGAKLSNLHTYPHKS